MGLFKEFFKSKRTNFFEKIANEFANEEKKKVLLNSPFIDKNRLDINEESILSFVIASFNFEIEFNPKLKSMRLKSDYVNFIENVKKTPSFKSFYHCMLEYYKGSPNLDKALLNITYAYLESVWKIDKITVADPILITTYNIYLSQIRKSIKNRIENSLTELFEI